MGFYPSEIDSIKLIRIIKGPLCPNTLYIYNDMVAKSIGDDTNYKQLLILPFDN